MLVYNGGIVRRVQIKTTLRYDSEKDRYSVKTMKRVFNTRIPYSIDDTDFICIYVGDKSWYIIPIEVVAGKGVVNLYPHRQSAGKYEMYRDAWELLLK